MKHGGAFLALIAASLVSVGGLAAQAASRPVAAANSVDDEAQRIVAKMSLEHKVAAAPDWLKLADSMWDAARRPLPDGEPVVPLLWATDAVHGHNNVPGATLFPHNIGLGAAGDEALVRRIGQATAAEIAATGIDWTFAPTLAVVKDVRWGRAYESYGQDQVLVARLGSAMIDGLQGRRGTRGFLDQRHVIATAKHFFGDGGTGGKDQGDTVGKLAAIEAVHAAPYPPAIRAGVQTVMASFNSINGVKMHGNRALLTGVLRDRMKFGGVVVGDWNGHGQIPGCTNVACPQALLAGLDIYMVPEDWKALYANLVAEARAGTIPMARIDQAATRVIALKLRAGVFAKPRPSARALGGQWAVIGSPEHRDVAREAVRKSLVLLKNEAVLPIRSSTNILVAGKAADNVPAQSGGWTISWQGGGDLTNRDLPGATSLFAGIAAAAKAGGGTATLSADGSFATRPDVAVVVFGEPPYAEFMGDRLDHRLDDGEGLALLAKYKAQGIPTVAVLLSGRPLWMNREIAAADAFVAAWLPGSEGGGLADVLVGDRRGRARHDFVGRLPFDWPADCAVTSKPLVGAGFGGSYRRAAALPVLNQSCARVAGAPADRDLFARGPVSGTLLSARDAGGSASLLRWIGQSPSAALSVRPLDIAAQEDGRAIEWTGPADLLVALGNAPAGPKGSVELEFALASAAGGTVTLGADCVGCQTVSLDSTIKLAADKGYRIARIPLACLADRSIETVKVRAEAPVALKLKSLRIVSDPGPSSCQGPF